MNGVVYQVRAWKENDELDLSPCFTYSEAIEEGKQYYPEGYDIEEIYLNEEE